MPYFRNIVRVALAALSIDENAADKENTENATNAQQTSGRIMFYINTLNTNV